DPSGRPADPGAVLLLSRPEWIATTLWTSTALLAFAANSLLCRQALSRAQIDPLGFTLVRILSGAAVLFPLAQAARPGAARRHARDAGARLWRLERCLLARRLRRRLLVGLHVAERGNGLPHPVRRCPGDHDRDRRHARRAARPPALRVTRGE